MYIMDYVLDGTHRDHDGNIHVRVNMCKKHMDEVTNDCVFMHSDSCMLCHKIPIDWCAYSCWGKDEGIKCPIQESINKHDKELEKLGFTFGDGGGEL